MRKKIIAGNWKMNPDFAQGIELIEKIKTTAIPLIEGDGVQILIFPPYIYLNEFAGKLSTTKIGLGSQNVASTKNGAYTGEISASMLKSMQIKYCLIGHSERREYFNEDEKLLLQKIKLLLDENIIPIYCCGERLTDRQNNEHFAIVKDQISKIFLELTREEAKKIIIAYEPVWAIGTGVVATPQQAQEMHAFIRNEIRIIFDEEVAEGTSILYGGSVKASNSAELFSCNDIDGALVGGASLLPDDFCGIIKNSI